MIFPLSPFVLHPKLYLTNWSIRFAKKSKAPSSPFLLFKKTQKHGKFCRYFPTYAYKNYLAHISLLLWQFFKTQNGYFNQELTRIYNYVVFAKLTPLVSKDQKNAHILADSFQIWRQQQLLSSIQPQTLSFFS